MNAPRAGTDSRDRHVRRILAGLVLLLSAGIGFLVGSQHGKVLGSLTFLLCSAVSAMLHRLVTLFDESSILDRTTKKWHRRIIADAENKLGRKLSAAETAMITSRGGGVALEMIHDSVRAGTKEEVISYLNSESGGTTNHAS